jgi:hypothetical protein
MTADRSRWAPSWRHVCAVVVLATTGTVWASAASGATKLPAVVDSPGYARGQVVAFVRPQSIIFTPTAGGPIFQGPSARTGIRWTTWTADSAVGFTLISVDTDNPDLVAGYRTAESATITLSRPRLIEHRLLFTRMALSNVKVLKKVKARPVPLHYKLLAKGYWGKGYGWS